MKKGSAARKGSQPSNSYSGPWGPGAGPSDTVYLVKKNQRQQAATTPQEVLEDYLQQEQLKELNLVCQILTRHQVGQAVGELVDSHNLKLAQLTITTHLVALAGLEDQGSRQLTVTTRQVAREDQVDLRLRQKTAMAHLVGQADLTDQGLKKDAGMMAEQEHQKDQEMRLKKRSLSVASIPLHRVLERLKPPTATIVQEGRELARKNQVECTELLREKALKRRSTKAWEVIRKDLVSRLAKQDLAHQILALTMTLMRTMGELCR